MLNVTKDKQVWIYNFRKRILLGILGILGICIGGATLFLLLGIKERLINEEARRSRELGSAITSTLRLQMLDREPQKLNATLKALGSSPESSIKRVILINDKGTVAYSNDDALLGTTIDRTKESSCMGCHTGNGTMPSDEMTEVDGLQRHVTVFRNDAECHACHGSEKRINGKLIIDRSMDNMIELLRSVIWLVAGSGVLGLIFLIPLLSKGLDKYIDEINRQETELGLLYVMVERLSKTIDSSELRIIIFEIGREIMDPDRIDIIMPGRLGTTHAYSMTKGRPGVSRDLMPEAPSALGKAVESWLSGKGCDRQCEILGEQLVMPLWAEREPLALIAIQRADRNFPEDKIRLIRAMCDHIAVALENARLYTLAITDDLTGFYAARHFHRCIERAMDDYQRFGERFILLMTDLDDFKRVNDTQGHPSGDIVLREVTSAIGSAVRDGDMCFRYGGEEFAIILRATDMPMAVLISNRIMEAVRQSSIDVGKATVNITISIGISSCPENGTSVLEVIDAADKALYRAKHAGKDRTELAS